MATFFYETEFVLDRGVYPNLIFSEVKFASKPGKWQRHNNERPSIPGRRNVHVRCNDRSYGARDCPDRAENKSVCHRIPWSKLRREKASRNAKDGPV